MKLRNKKVLVTGACGFIGSHLVERLIEEGCHVRAFVWYNSFNSHGWMDSLPSGKKRDVEIFSGDIRDEDNVKESLKEIDVVFHLAALIGIPYSYRSPSSYVDTNIIGTLNLLRASRDAGIEKLIHTSTSEVYGTARYVPMDEKHPLQPQSPYSATKIGADAVAESFYRSFGLPVSIARPFNTYGPRQSARAVIPTIITQILSGAEIIKLGDVTPKRDFNYVKDTCEGFFRIASSDKTIGEVVNIGSNTEISVKETLALITKITGSRVKFISESKRLRPVKSEVRRLWCDNSKICKLTGYKPKYDIATGLEETVEWFRRPENLRRYKEGIYNV